MEWTEVQITTTNEAEEAVAAIFYDFGALGLAIRDSNDFEALRDDDSVILEQGLIDDLENTSIISAYFEEDALNDGILEEILLRIKKLPEYGLNPGDIDYTLLKVKNENWENSWKKYFVSNHITPRITVIPSWQRDEPPEGKIVIYMDPGMAFGTGLHETTRLCAILLEDYLNPHQNVLDVGCGTGILSMIAKKLGANHVTSIDIDPLAIKVAKENFLTNDLESIELIQSDLTEGLSTDTEYDLIVANILSGPIHKLIPQVAELLEPNKLFICSGFLQSEVEPIYQQLDDYDFEIIDISSYGEWCALVSRKN